MSSREDVRATLLTLLLAGKSVKEIVADVQCGRMLVYEIKKRLAAGTPPQASSRKRRRMTLTPTVVVGLPPHQSGSDQEPPDGGQESSVLANWSGKSSENPAGIAYERSRSP